MRHFRIVIAVGFAALPLTAFAQHKNTAADTFVVTTEWVAAHLKDPKVALVEVVADTGPSAKGHIPGSRLILYQDFTAKVGELSTELPPAEQLKDRLEQLGIRAEMRVVAYGEHAPMATRFLMTLDYLGLRKISYLDGGLVKWKSEQRATVPTGMSAARSSLTVHTHPEIIATADWITPRLGKPGLALIDTRTDGEYNGTGNRSGMPSAGHLEGAQQMEWESLFQKENPTLLKDHAELVKMFADRVHAGDTVVTYCWIGYRASATYFAARILGYDAKFYDGSYQDWQLRKLPAKAGATP